MSTIRKTCTDDTCCLYDSEGKNFQCATRDEENDCSYYDPNPSRYCSIHNKLCGQLYGSYKATCDSVWNTPYDLEDYSDEQLETIRKTAQKCRDIRREHLYECNRGVPTVGHLGALQKMDAIIQRIGEELEDRAELYQEGELKALVGQAKRENSDLYRRLKVLGRDTLIDIINKRIDLSCRYRIWENAGFPSNINALDFDRLHKEELIYFILLGRNCVQN